MAQPLTVFQPRSFGAFQCIHSACEDSCCFGWDVVVDKPTFDKYRSCDDSVLRSIMDADVVVIEGSTHESAHAMVAHSRGGCPFLTESRLCGIQARLGEGYLSRACSTYPRSLNVVDGVVEGSLYMSCPEAARCVLLDPDSMRLERAERRPTLRVEGPPTLDTSDRSSSNKPYEHFPAVRKFVTAILTNRAYQLWERLLILGLFCEHLDRVIAANADDNVADMVDGYTKQIDEDLFAGAFKDVPNQPRFQIDFVSKWVEARIAEGDIGPRFLNTYREFQEGIGGPSEDSAPEWGNAAVRVRSDMSIPETLLVGVPAAPKDAEAYAQAYARYYQPFMSGRAHIMENYLLNYVFKALFPFGPQKSLYLVQRSVSTEYTLLIVHYALVRSLLVGVAAYHKETFGEGHVVAVVQSFSKAIEHSLPFLQRILEFVESRNLNNLVSLAALIRD